MKYNIDIIIDQHSRLLFVDCARFCVYHVLFCDRDRTGRVKRLLAHTLYPANQVRQVSLG